MIIEEVWSDNFESQMDVFDVVLRKYNVISIDTEFPGFVRQTPRYAVESVLYQDTKYNIDSTKLIQLGITLSDELGEGYVTWQFNFAGFDPENDMHNEGSLRLLKQSGFDFEKMKKEGIDWRVFADKFLSVVSARSNLKWVTFHGLYDMAYLLKVISGQSLPNTASDFARRVGDVFGLVYDVKYMARYCEGLKGGEIGLERLAVIMGVKRIGESHQAGSDSLLTASVYAKMKEVYGVEECLYGGFLYGIGAKIECMRPILGLTRTKPRSYPPPLLTRQSPPQHYFPRRIPLPFYNPPPMYCDAPVYFLAPVPVLRAPVPVRRAPVPVRRAPVPVQSFISVRYF